jgi:hypothetical protein
VAAIAKHPTLAGAHLWHATGSLWGYISAGGVIGMLNPLSAPAWMTLLEGGIGRAAGVTQGWIAMSPWQMIGSVYFIGPSSVISLAWLLTRHGRLGNFCRRYLKWIIGVMLVNALIWSAIWTPIEIKNLNLTPAATVAALDHVETLVPHQNELVASWSVTGRFGQRKYLFTPPLRLGLRKHLHIRLYTPTVDFIVAPWTGLATEGPNQIGLLSALSSTPGVTLLYAKAQVWLFAYHRRPKQKFLHLDVSYLDVPGAVLPFPIGQKEGAGFPTNSCLFSDRYKEGYMMSRLTQHLKVGYYQVEFNIDSQVPVVLEVLDDDTKQLLARSYDVVIKGPHTLTLDFNITQADLFHNRNFQVPWPYHFDQLPPLPWDTIQFRLWSAGNGLTSVCSASLFLLSSQPSPSV